MSIYDEPAPYISPRERRARTMLRFTLTSMGVVILVVASFVVVKAGAEAVLGQCAPPWLTGTDPQLCLNTSISQRQLLVSGTTSLPDGAIIQVSAQDGPDFGTHWQTDVVNVQVSQGSFQWSFDVSTWGAGTVTTTAEFRIGPGQPATVVDRYGPNGERIVGPDVTLDFQSGDPPPRTVQVSVDTDLSAG